VILANHGERESGSKMQVEWEYTAETFFDQLSRPDQAKVLHALDRLSNDSDGRAVNELHKIAGSEEDLFSLLAGADIIVVMRKQDDKIIVVDVVPKRQIEGMRRAISAQAVPG